MDPVSPHDSSHPSSSLNSSAIEKKITAILQRIRAGQMVIMVDDDRRENEGDLVMAAEDITAEDINFMAKEARGLICLPMEEELIRRLKLPMMSDHSKTEDSRHTAFTVSIEARRGVSTGISARDRATTIQCAISDDARPDDIVVPGHIFPLKARQGGVLTRAGHTEGSVDLAKLAGKKGASVICEIMNDDGTMARAGDLKKFSERHGIPIVSIEELIHYRLLYDSLIEEIRREKVKTAFGSFKAVWFGSTVDHSQHVALVRGRPQPDQVTEVRVYRQRFFEDLFGPPSPVPNRPRRVEYGLHMLGNCEVGVYLYLAAHPPLFRLPSPPPSPGTEAESKAGRVEDPRLYGVGAQILRKLGVGQLTLNTLAPRKLAALGGFGLEIVSTKVMGREYALPRNTQHNTHTTDTHTQDTPADTPYHHNNNKVPQQRPDRPGPSNHATAVVVPAITPQPKAEQAKALCVPKDKGHHMTNPGSMLDLHPSSIKEAGKKPHNILIIASRWHREIVEGLIAAATRTLLESGVPASSQKIWWVPGAYELISALTTALKKHHYDAVICFGCILKGKTAHNDLIAQGINQALVSLQIKHGVPIIHGVIVADCLELAMERSSEDSPKNRGHEAARTVTALLDDLQAGPQEFSHELSQKPSPLLTQGEGHAQDNTKSNAHHNARTHAHSHA